MNPLHKDQAPKRSVVLLFIRNCIKHTVLPDPNFNILDSLWYEVQMLSGCAGQLIPNLEQNSTLLPVMRTIVHFRFSHILIAGDLNRPQLFSLPDVTDPSTQALLELISNTHCRTMYYAQHHIELARSHPLQILF